MKNIFLVLTLALFIGACSQDKVTVIHNNDRVTDLERRMALNEQLDASQSEAIQLNYNALAAEAEAREDMDEYILSLIQQEQDARAAGDQDLADSLAASIAQQDAINIFLQSQIDSIANQLPTINSTLESLQSQLDQTNVDLDTVASELTNVSSQLSGLNSTVNALSSAYDDLATQVNSLQAQIDAEGVKVFKCNSASSTERILKINGKYYGAMNRVTLKNIEVIAGSSSVTYTTPAMCRNSDGSLKMPNSGGQCTPNSGPFASTLIPGNSIVVASYTTEHVNVVDSVKIAIDILVDGSYQTTDGGPACSFSISNSGTSATNLIQVQ